MSHNLPPPPSEFPEDSTPGAHASAAPAPAAYAPAKEQEETPVEVFETDVLKRRGKFSWRQFGGDGFMVSLAVHLIVGIAALYWVVSTYIEPEKKGDPEVFATGSGGGNNGNKAKNFEHKLKSRNSQVKMPSRIVSKNANASISLPSTPNSAAPAFATGLSSGGMSKGSGGGSGGGIGTGIGVGQGGGRNFVSLFGRAGLNVPGLPGTFYDGKQAADGKPSKFADDATNRAFADEVIRAFVRTFDRNRLDRFFKAPDQLAASQIFIPARGADAAPAAYGVQDKVKGKRWIAVYSGTITAPKTGKFRFWGLGDDTLVVRVDGKLVLDAGWLIATAPGGNDNHAATDRVLGISEKRKGRPGAPFRAGPWIDFTKGRESAMELLISEIPGGAFGAWLLMEEAGPDGKGDGKLFLFRMTDDPLPEGLKDDTGLNVDMTGKGFQWNARAPKTSRSVR